MNFLKKLFKCKHDYAIYLEGDKTVWECRKCGRKMTIG